MWGNALLFRFWLALCEAFNIRAYSIELRGHGESRNGDIGYQSVEDYAKDVHIAIAEQITECILVGWSMGGLIAQLVAARSTLIKRLVLVSSAAPRGILPRGKVLLKMLKPRYLWALTFGRWLNQSFRISRKDAFELMCNTFSEGRELNDFLTHLSPESGRAASQVALGVEVGKINCPVLVISAEKDVICPDSMQVQISGRYKATYLKIAGASHAVMVQPTLWESTGKSLLNWAYQLPQAA